MDGAEGFEAVFDELASIAYRVGYRLLGDRAAAEDIAQEALARALVRWRRVEGHAVPWVIRVSTNLALDRLRGSSRAVVRQPPEQVADDDPERSALRLTLARQLAALPRRQREVVALRYLADLTEVQVAAALGLSQGSVKRHTGRGLAALRSVQIEGVV